MALNEKEKAKLRDANQQAAIWLDSIIRPLVPKFLIALQKRMTGGIIGRLLHFFIDYVYVAKILKIKIDHGQDTTILGGNGFRTNRDNGYRIDRIRIKVTKRGKQIAETTFPVNITIKNNP